MEQLEPRQMLTSTGLGTVADAVAESRPLATHADHDFAHYTQFRISRQAFEESVSRQGDVDRSDPTSRHPASLNSTSRNPFNGNIDYSGVVFRATMEAGSATGAIPDTPADRVDPNDATARFSGVGSLQIVQPGGDAFICTGSLISDRHVLTAGHCFDRDRDGTLDAGLIEPSRFFLNDRGSPSATLEISEVDVHPDFGGFTSTGGANDDFAVVTLSAAVPAGTVAYPIRGTGMSLGEAIEMVGYGVSGQGDVAGDEQLADLHVKRSGQNHVDLFVTDDEGSGTDEMYIYDFDGPTGTGFLGGGTLGNDIETVVGLGDSGSPAFVSVGKSLAIAGVNTFVYSLEGTTAPPGTFGVIGGGQIIGPAQLQWIADVLDRTGHHILPLSSVGDDIAGFSVGAGLWLSESNGSTWNTTHAADGMPELAYSQVSSADVDGDGLDDMVALAEDGRLIVSLATGSSSFTTQVWGSLTTMTTWSDLQIGDFNGDGMDDIMVRADRDGTFWLAESTGDRFRNSYWGKLVTQVTWTDMNVGDFNGDGMDDIVARAASDGTWWAAISDGDSLTNAYWGKWSTAVAWSDVNVGDFNGDGRDDIAGRAANSDWWVNVSAGSYFSVEYWGRWNGAVAWADVLVGDFDGDGSDDIAGRANGAWWLASYNGTRFVNRYWGAWSTSATWSHALVIDINQDGKHDLVGLTESGQWWASQSSGSSFTNYLAATWPPGLTWQYVSVGNLLS